jgi:hypothetical protein
VGQTVPLNLSAYALKHNWSGAPETNHARAIQVEVLGFARDGLRDPAMCDWLGRRVLGPVLKAGVPINLSHLARTAGSSAAGVNGAVRMSTSQWYAFDGICGHQNVPRNDHWDPGVSDYARIARAAGALPPPPPEPPTDEDDEMVIVRKMGTTQTQAIIGGKRIGISGEQNVENAKLVGIPVWVVEPDEFDRITAAFT